MKSCCLAYIQQGRIIYYFCLNCRDYKSNCSGSPILKFEHSFLNNFDFPVFFEKFLSAVCFRDLFEIRIINYLRAIDGPVSFLRLSVF